MHINCINCGHRFDVGRAYDDYEGMVKCPTCRTLLEIRTQDGNLKMVRPAAFSFAAAQPQANQPAAGANTTPGPTAPLRDAA